MKNGDVFYVGYLLNVLKKHLAFIVISGILCAAIGFSVSEFVIEKKYESKALLYVENSLKTSDSVNLNDINASQQLVYACQIIFKSNTVLGKLIDNLDLPYSKKELEKMISAQSVNDTQVMRLVARTSDPEESEKIVNELVNLSKAEFSNIVKSGSLEVIDYGEINTSPSSPNVILFTAAGLLAGVAAAYLFALIGEITDVAVKRDDSLENIYSIPVLACIYDFAFSSNGKYGYAYKSYGYGKRRGRKKSPENISNRGKSLLSEETPFEITEAYNLARTNIMFATSTSSSRIIAVTSSNSSEGKSTTCANIAISFANAGLKVLLIECDMRKPVIADLFGIKPQKGLSALISGLCGPDEVLCSEVLNNLDIISAGEIPPNPSELLTSELMKKILKVSVNCYDYIFLDTPPVNVVTDSQLLNDEIAGIIFIVREGKTTHPEIQSALEKIRLANGKTLGIVKTFHTPEKAAGYGKKRSRLYYYTSSYRRESKRDTDAEADGAENKQT